MQQLFAVPDARMKEHKESLRFYFNRESGFRCLLFEPDPWSCGVQCNRGLWRDAVLFGTPALQDEHGIVIVVNQSGRSIVAG